MTSEAQPFVLFVVGLGYKFYIYHQRDENITKI
jgi:hypothetical protein